jgi:dTDP-glucose 4,6-dehydratase
MNILITGGAGFIGSHTVRYFVKNYPAYKIYNVDSLTYAGNLESLKDVEECDNYTFIKGDIRDKEFINQLFQKYKFDSVIHLAAESHVDRSISGPLVFVETNVLGTLNLLDVAKNYWSTESNSKNIFYHISTDEVYGSLDAGGYFTEHTPYDPRSPYSASKAGSDHLVRAYFHTYNLPVVISNCSNNYGPFQFPEKLIPLIINNILNQIPLPVYGKGENIRDWIWVEDHVEAINTVFHKGIHGNTYNIGGNNEWKNIDLVKLLCNIVDEKTGKAKGSSQNLITFVKDRAGHDLRYAIDASKIKNELGWEPSVEFEKGLKKTVEWYLDNKKWVNHITSGEYQNYYKKQYINR